MKFKWIGVKKWDTVAAKSQRMEGAPNEKLILQVFLFTRREEFLQKSVRWKHGNNEQLKNDVSVKQVKKETKMEKLWVTGTAMVI